MEILKALGSLHQETLGQISLLMDPLWPLMVLRSVSNVQARLGSKKENSFGEKPQI